jgi:hypothetical protein
VFSDGLAAVQVDGKYGYINQKGEKIIPPIYEIAFYFKEGFAYVSYKGKWGIIDKKGHVIPNV